jgi:CRISPR-associated endonuclease Cas1 subtype II
MSWRTVIISQNAKLDYQMGYLVVRGRDTRKVYLNEINILMIEDTSVSMTAYLLSELMKNKIKVIFCDEKRNPSSELLPYYGSHDTSFKIRNQIEWSQNEKAIIWTEIVKEKINQQSKVLDAYGYYLESEMLQSYIGEMMIGDTTNREGHAAKVYFNALFGKKFSRSEENPTNAALNYGYSILLSMFNREIVANGYLTQLGLFHNNMFNQFNLASDLMEVFRPLVDQRVVELSPEYFQTEEKREIIKIIRQEIYIAGRTECLDNAVKIYTRSIFDALNNRDSSLIKFGRYEL